MVFSVLLYPLLERAGTEEKDQFHREISLMQRIGSHRNEHDWVLGQVRTYDADHGVCSTWRSSSVAEKKKTRGKTVLQIQK